MRSILVLLCLTLAACARVATTPPAGTPPPANDRETRVHFAAERVSSSTIRLSLDNGETHPIGYNLCSSTLHRRSGSAWNPVDTGEMCTMELRTLNPGFDATFEKTLPATLPAGDYRYVTRVESPLGSSGVTLATASFSR